MQPFSVFLPNGAQSGVLFNSPHSGVFLPDSLQQQIAVDPALLHYSGDTLVDQLIQNVPRHGAIALVNHYARVYVDTNRAANEIDPDMFDDDIMGTVASPPAPDRSDKVIRGFGVISRKTYNGQEIYSRKLPALEIRRRLDQVYYPVHRALQDIVRRLYDRHRYYLLVDCHSMPSYRFIKLPAPRPAQPDLIIGNCFHTSCSRTLTQYVADYFTRQGLNVTFNTPYAGGYNTRHYGRLADNRHSLQLEFNRALYLCEQTLAPNADFGRLQAMITGLSKTLHRDLPQLVES